MSKHALIAGALMATLMAGCTSTQTLSEKGRRLDFRPDSGIVIGQTSKRQVFDRYGQPTDSSIKGKYEILAYSYVKETYEAKGVGSFALDLIPVVGEAKGVYDIARDRGNDMKTNTEWQELALYLDLTSGIVRDYYYHDSQLRGHDESESLYLQSQAAFKQNQSDEGVQLLEKAVAANPNNHRAANELAWRLIDLGIDVDRGIVLASKAVQVFPDSPYNNGTLGIGYLKKGDMANAEKYLQTAVELFPTYAPQDVKSLQHDKAMLQTIKAQKNS